jgi:flavin reductase (DIM6/NTAB) family NADH-FMN oxidoreductase RutF
MARTSLPPQVLIPVRPILVVGASIDSVANFMEAAGGGLVSTDPPMIALPLRHERYTLKGIMQYKTFSVAIP